MRYKALALDPFSRHMSLPVLRKIRDLVANGATVVGGKPIDTPSLGDDASEFQAIVGKLWPADSNASPKGHVFDKPLAGVLTSMNIEPDFTFAPNKPDTELLFVHRKLHDADLYYVDNRRDRPESLTASFRIQGKEAELWHADTGLIEPASYHTSEGRTSVPLELEPWGTVFVVFRHMSQSASRTLPKAVERTLQSVDGPWDLEFQSDRGAPAHATFDKLTAWNENNNPGIKYFSGVATYVKTVQADSDWFKRGSRLWLDLGDVKNLAQVSVNGQQVAIVWKAPYRVDLTAVLKPGVNELRISVVNAWVNRMIGDRQPGVTHKIAFTSPEFYKADSPLLPSGMLGPVQILQSTVEP